jgi:pyrroloquinoline quinone (PQQ) biosynthesis protein C
MDVAAARATETITTWSSALETCKDVCQSLSALLVHGQLRTVNCVTEHAVQRIAKPGRVAQFNRAGFSLGLVGQGLNFEGPMQSPSLPFFVDLVARTDEARRAFETNGKVLDMVANGLTVERYRKLLLELYHVVWHFNPVCAAAASRISDQHKQVRYFLYDHMNEEKGHEEWVLNDLAAMGVEAQAAYQYRASPHMLALNGYNYWAADRLHPCSALGMLYALEVIASVYGGPISSAIKESLMLHDDRGISFISSHATLDAEHMADLRVVLNTLKDDEVKLAVIDSTVFNFFHFTRVLEAI